MDTFFVRDDALNDHHGMIHFGPPRAVGTSNTATGSSNPNP